MFAGDKFNSLLGFLLLGLGLFGLSYDYQENSNQLQDLIKRENDLRTTDTLTNLTSRQELIRQLPVLNNKIDNQEKKYTALQFRIDELHAINNQYGYSIGDTVLQELSKQLQHKSSYQQGSIIRLKGRELIVLVEGNPASETQ